MSRTNYIFVDYENVQEIDLDRIAQRPVKVTFVLGPGHKNLPVALVRKLLQYASQVSLVQTGRAGKNALDLVLSQAVGAARQADPAGYFHIISRDKGFDVLVDYLKGENVLAARHASLSEVSMPMSADERVGAVLAQLKANATGRPKKRKTLDSHIQSLFAKTLLPDEVEGIVQTLVTMKVLELSEKGEVAYKI